MAKITRADVLTLLAEDAMLRGLDELALIYIEAAIAATEAELRQIEEQEK